MSRKAHILNVSTGARIDHVLASGAIEACSAVWVVRNVSIRNVTEFEAVGLRNKQAAESQDRVGAHEVAGCVYVPPARNAESHRHERSYAVLARRVLGSLEPAPLVVLC
jgi:hypothetical protein